MKKSLFRFHKPGLIILLLWMGNWGAGVRAQDSLLLVNVLPSDTFICRGDSADLRVEVLGASGFFTTYSWQPNSGFRKLNSSGSRIRVGPQIQTKYTVTVRDKDPFSPFGRSAKDSSFVYVFRIDAGRDTFICPGQQVTLGASPTAIEGSPPYIVSWSPSGGLSSTSDQNPIAKPTATTTYTLTVSDDQGCVETDQVVVKNLGLPIANAGTDHEICYGDSTQLGGSPTASGTIAPYSYKWAPATALNKDTSANPWAKITSTQTFSLLVKDAHGCSKTAGVKVTVLPQLFADAGPDVIVCKGDTAQLGGSPSAQGGSPPYSYSWTPQLKLLDPLIANPRSVMSATTSFQLQVTDNKGCFKKDSVLARVYDLRANAGRDTLLCPSLPFIMGGAPTAQGGTAPYTYVWSPAQGIGNTTQANPQVTPQKKTEYAVLVQDANNCVAMDTVVLDLFTAYAGPDTSVCLGGSVVLGSAPASNGIFSPFTYRWTPSTGLNDSTLARPEASPTAPTEYVLTVTDADGCQSIKDTVLVAVYAMPVAHAGTEKFTCTDSTVTLGGSPSVTGGTAPYTYSWFPSIGLNNPSLANPQLAPDTTRWYKLTVQDSNKCVARDSLLIRVLKAEAGRDTALCQGQKAQIGGTLAAFDGTGVINYSWTPVDDLDSPGVQNPWVTPTQTRTYRLTVQSSNGCTAHDSVRVQLNANPQANAGGDTSYLCPGDSVGIGGSPVGSGGTGPYTYLWAPAQYISGSGQSNPKVAPPVSRQYRVQVTDAHGCKALDSTWVSVMQINAGLDRKICVGDSVVLGGLPASTGGKPGVSYSWTPLSGLSHAAASNPKASPQSTTQYVLRAEDSKGCVLRDTVTIELAPMLVNAGRDTGICAGQSVTLGSTPTAGGGFGLLTFLWAPSTPLNNAALANPVATVDLTTQFVLAVQDSLGCVSRDTAVITAFPIPVVNAGKDTVLCQGASTMLGGEPTGSGGTGVLRFSWTPNTALDRDTVPNPTVTPVDTFIWYRVSVTDSRACMARDSVLVRVDMVKADAGNDGRICFGDSLNLGGAPSGKPGAQFHWTPASGLSQASSPNPKASPASTTRFTLTVTHPASGCSKKDSMLLEIVDSLRTDAGPDLLVCSGDSVQLRAIGGSQFTWSPAHGLSNTQIADPKASPGNTTLYFVEAQSGVCLGRDTVKVTVHPLPVVKAQTSKDAICIGQEVTLSVSGAETYTWSPSQGLEQTTGSTVKAKPQKSTTYYVSGRNANGCIGVDSVHIKVNPLPNVVASSSSPNLCKGDSVELMANGAQDYTWSPTTALAQPNSASTKAWPSTTTTYTLTGTDANGCTNSAQLTLTVHEIIRVEASADKDSICLGASVRLHAQKSGNYQWSPASSLDNPNSKDPLATPGMTTTYTVQAQDGNGCPSSAQIKITVLPQVEVVASATMTEMCQGDSIELSANGAWTYTWGPTSGLSNPKIANPKASPNASLLYRVVGRTIFGCTGKDSIYITVKPSPTVQFSWTPVTPRLGTEIIFNKSGSVGGAAQLWDFGDPASGAENTSTLPEPRHTYGSAGLYTINLTLTASNGCQKSKSKSIQIMPVGLESAGLDAPYQVQPNPAYDQVWIKAGQPIDGQRQVCLRDISGRVMKQFPQTSGQETEILLGLEDVPAGVYRIQIKDRSGLYFLDLLRLP